MTETTREQDARIGRIAETFRTVRVGRPEEGDAEGSDFSLEEIREAGYVVAEGGEERRGIFVPARRYRIDPDGWVEQVGGATDDSRPMFKQMLRDQLEELSDDAG